MPVIREQKQFSIGPIGIARLSSPVAGTNAAGTIAETIASSANQMADMFFRQGAQAAEKKGLQQGASVLPEMIMAIDPITGAPKAYPPPKGMGIIAQDAYQRVVQTRFQTGIENELKLKAAELAAKYNGSVDRYTAAMSEYIGAMAETAQGQFKGLIVDIGTSYLNATRTSMALDQIDRERAAAKKANDATTAAGLTTLENSVASGGLPIFE